MKALIQTHAAVRRMAMSIVALHVVAKIIDYYITKYAAKPMEQLQNLVTQYALGLRRLEIEEAEEEAKTASTTSSEVLQLAGTEDNRKMRSRRVLLRLQHAANRSKWISSTESALFVHTEQQHWASHNEVPMFLSRALYQISECKRILSDDGAMITRPDTTVQLSVVNYESTQALSGVSQLARDSPDLDAPQGQNAPRGIYNIGNTCFMNAILQCCRQLLSRIPSNLLPDSERCPLAMALQQQAFSQQDIEQWECWKYIPIGAQRDACQILEMCFDQSAPMHSACEKGDCYAVLLQNMTSFEVVRELFCDHCAFSTQESQKQCVLHVEPHSDAETSISESLRVIHIDDFTCGTCGGKGARQQTRLCDLPPFLVVHINKYAANHGPPMDALVRISGTDMQRFAVTHHAGHTPYSGHYTATVTTQEGMTYYCDDSVTCIRPDLCASPWPNSYLIFLCKLLGEAQVPSIAGSCDEAPLAVNCGALDPSGERQDDPECNESTCSQSILNSAVHCSDTHPAANSVADTMEVEVHNFANGCEDLHLAATSCDLLGEAQVPSSAGSCDEAPLAANCGALDPSRESQHAEECDEGIDDEGIDDENIADEGTAEACAVHATECRVTSSRHDDWLHRGPFLADLPWQAYMMRVRRVRKPTEPNAAHSELFYFDKHYALSALYCQQIRYTTQTAIPRLVGSVCPPEEEDNFEPHAAYKLMLFSRARCPGPDHCADPFAFRTLMIPSDKPDDKNATTEKPRFVPSWRACKCEMERMADMAATKEKRARKIAVLADTTTMKDMKERSGDTHPTAKQTAFRLRPHLNSENLSQPVRLAFRTYATWHRTVG